MASNSWIDVGDGCWTRNGLVTYLASWWPASSFALCYRRPTNQQNLNSVTKALNSSPILSNITVVVFLLYQVFVSCWNVFNCWCCNHTCHRMIYEQQNLWIFAFMISSIFWKLVPVKRVHPGAFAHLKKLEIRFDSWFDFTCPWSQVFWISCKNFTQWMLYRFDWNSKFCC